MQFDIDIGVKLLLFIYIYIYIYIELTISTTHLSCSIREQKMRFVIIYYMPITTIQFLWYEYFQNNFPFLHHYVYFTPNIPCITFQFQPLINLYLIHIEK